MGHNASITDNVTSNWEHLKMLVVTWHALDQSRCVLQLRRVTTFYSSSAYTEVPDG